MRLALLERLTGLDPLFGVLTLGNGMQTSLLQIGFGLTVVLGGLALVLTVSGLFSVLSYLVEQQAKEIGVRMALGAATLNVVRLVLSQSLRPVGIGLAAGGGWPQRWRSCSWRHPPPRRSAPWSMSSIPWRTPRARS